MLPTMPLPCGVRVSDARERVREALEEFETIEPKKYALTHWLAGSYRRALAGAVNDHSAITLGMPSTIEASIMQARRVVADLKARAKRSDASLVDHLPSHVPVVRITDGEGAFGFAPIDIRGATLLSRVLSILVADYLMRPEDYVGDPETGIRSREVLPERDATPRAAM